ncbi:MAG: hypothetical protein CSA95_06980 [Bacteroidetes bacterium]|nr:MAG: hypothetical protein CSA95_06980 [Bacteroidota bacterium]
MRKTALLFWGSGFFVLVAIDCFVSLHKARGLSSRCMEPSNSRLVKAEKREFTKVNDPLEEKYHKEVGFYRRTLFNLC